MVGFSRTGRDAMADDPKPLDPLDATQWHEVVPGDTLSKLAEKYYGDPSLYPQIFEANQDQLHDPDKIKVGQKLRIP
jgi:nucleoid-associated protein YgaU